MEAWQKLIRVLTHEIMNSITPIISLSETLSERGIPESLGEKEYSIMLQAMQTIHRRSKGLLGFVENYRRLTRIPTPVRTKVFRNARIRFIFICRPCTDRASAYQLIKKCPRNVRAESR